NNSRNPSKVKGELTVEEIGSAEKTLVKLVQIDSFPKDQESISGIRVEHDKDGIIRVKTKLLYRDDALGFRYPMLLPHSHPLVDQIIRQVHENCGHSGVQFLMGKLREKFWILRGRK